MKWLKQFLVLAILSIAMLSSVSAVSINGQEGTTNDILTIITGTVLNETDEPLAGVPVTAYCRHDGTENEIETVETTISGSYSASVLNLGFSAKCVKGDDAWVIVDYAGEAYKSEEVTVKRMGSFFDYAFIPGVGVPEFSPLTAGLALMGTMVGLFVLRKRK